MSDFVEFDADDGSTMNVEPTTPGKVTFCLDGPTDRDSDELEFDIDKEQAIDIILLLEAAFS